MNEFSDKTSDQPDPVEGLLARAKPRPRPPIDDEREVRAALHAEWQQLVARRNRGRQLTWLAAAATLLISLGVLYSTLLAPGAAPVEVATIDRHDGMIYLLGDRSTLIELGGDVALDSGQVIETGAASSLGLRWNAGGSLRLDESTRVEFIDEQRVYLERGRLYFDSQSADPAAPGLVVRTEHGSIRHVGTQYMAETNLERLIVSVREGRVEIEGRYHDESAPAGKRVEFRGSSRPVILDDPGYGDAWSWVEAVTPGVDLNDRSVFDFLEWVSRETGFDVAYNDPAAEALARSTTLRGSVDTDPRTALRLRMMTTDLEAELDGSEGQIHVRIARQAVP